MKPDLDRRALAAGLAVGLLWLGLSALALPADTQPRVFPDSAGYVDWPAAYVSDGLRVIGARAPGYPLFLKLVGTGRALVYVQTGLSVGAWLFLGFLAGRSPGLVVAGLLALAPSVRIWNAGVVTESLSLSGLVALVAATLLAVQRLTVGRALLWAGLAVAWGMLRDTNPCLLPFLWAPLALHGRRSLPLLALALLVVGLGAVDAARNDRWQWGRLDVLLQRVVPDPEARRVFADAGMPAGPRVLELAREFDDPLERNRARKALHDELPELSAWIDRDGNRTYLRWLLTRPASYTDPLRAYAEALSDPGPVRWFRAFLGGRRPLLDESAGRVFGWVLPLPLWSLIALLPLAERALLHRVGARSLVAAALVVGNYVQIFAVYHADSDEVWRHLLSALVVHRLAQWLALAAVVSMLIRQRREGGAAQSAVAASASDAVSSSETRVQLSSGSKRSMAWASFAVSGPRSF